jgi:hypothetical protein
MSRTEREDEEKNELKYKESKEVGGNEKDRDSDEDVFWKDRMEQNSRCDVTMCDVLCVEGFNVFLLCS